MKISDIESAGLRNILDKGEFGKLLVDQIEGSRDVYGFMKIDLGEGITAVMGYECYLPDIDKMTPDEIENALRSAATRSSTIDYQRINPLVYIDERDRSVYAGAFVYSFGSHYGLYEEETFTDWRTAFKEALASDIEEKVANTLFAAVRTESIDSSEIKDGSYRIEREKAEREYIESKDLDVFQRCSGYAHQATKNVTFDETGAYDLLRNRSDLEENLTESILERESYSGRSWVDTCSESIRVEDAIMRELHHSPIPDLVMRRNMYRALNERFSGDEPNTVKLIFTGHENEEPFTIEYRTLKAAVTGQERNLWKSSFAASDRVRMQNTLGLDKWGDAPLEAIETILYRGKPVYERAVTESQRTSPSLNDVAKEAKAATESQTRNELTKEHDAR